MHTTFREACDASQTFTIRPIDPMDRFPLYDRGDMAGTRVGIVDTETTGTGDQDVPWEISLLELFLPDEGEAVICVGHQSWLQHPSVIGGPPITPEIMRLCGVSDDALEGKQWNGREIYESLEACDVLVAHKADFDYRMLGRAIDLPDGPLWADSLSMVDWGEAPFGRTITGLMAERGWYFGAHRALDDCAAVAMLLGADQNSRGLVELIEEAEREQQYIGASIPFHLKDQLKAFGGWMWDGNLKIWYAAVSNDAEMAARRGQLIRCRGSMFKRAIVPGHQRVTQPEPVVWEAL